VIYASNLYIYLLWLTYIKRAIRRT